MNKNFCAINANKKNGIFYLFSALLIVMLMILGSKLGSTEIAFKDVLEVLLSKIGIVSDNNINKSVEMIILELRLPRMLLALAVGGGLAICGVAMQAVTQNVLADPYILGVSSGAAFSITIAHLIIPTSAVLLSAFVPAFAFLGAMTAMYLVYQIGGTRSSNQLILAGMAISIMLNAMTNFVIHFLPDSSVLKNITMWMWGSLASARWNNITVPIFASVIVLMFFVYMSRQFNIISLGSETAASLGSDVRKMRKITMLLVAFLTGILIASSGLIGFIGFIIPHAIRMIKGSDHRGLLKRAYVVGGIFLLSMDILARTLLPPREIAVGIFSAFLGGPFFIWLLYIKSKGKKV